MCTVCGCSDTQEVNYIVPGAPAHNHARDGHEHTHDLDQDHAHVHPHDHDHDHAHPHGRTVAVAQDILAKNQALAERNRGWLEGRGVLALNLMSAPGSGKTTLLERSIRALAGEMRVHVVEGDQATTNDAERIRATGVPVIQVNTGAGCHLEADMLARCLRQLDPQPGSVVLIENVGNLVCPALFDLGERAKVMVISVTEGDDKPAKYPHMVRACGLLLINKIDLLPHVRFDIDRCAAHARDVNPQIEIRLVSAETGEGMESWYEWLRRQHAGGAAMQAA